MIDIGYAGAVLGGILALLSPCSVMLLPSFFAYAFASPRALLARTGVFYLGLAATLVPLGVFAGTLGSFVTQNRGALVAIAAGLIIVLGIVQIAGLRLPSFARRGAAEGTTGYSVFILGAVYGVAGVCTGPILGSVLTVAALGSNAIYGGTLLALYALGMAIPLFVLAILWTKLRLGQRAWLRPRPIRVGRWTNTWAILVSGIVSVAIGVFLLVTDGTTSLGGVLTVGDQLTVEAQAQQAAAGIPNTVVAIGAAVILVAVASAYILRGRMKHAQGVPSD
jgi:cytochrome c-type biogenesis protein